LGSSAGTCGAKLGEINIWESSRGGIGGTRGGEGLTEMGGLGRDVWTDDEEEQGGALTTVYGGVGAGSCAQRPSNFAI
jgi:hypothetical protein